MADSITVNFEQIYQEQAKITDIEDYIKKAISLAGEGNDVTLTGKAPIWLYLKIAHALHGKVKILRYDSPVSGSVIIFNHDPF